MNAITDELMPEWIARRIIAGIQDGGVDETDLRCLAADWRAWIAESEGWTATDIREGE